MIDSSVVVFLLSFCVKVYAQSTSNHVNDPIERLINKVFLFVYWWGLWWILVMWWWREGLDHLVLLVHMVLLVGVVLFIMELSLVILLGVVSVCDVSLVFRWLISGHPIFGSLGFRAIPSGVRGVFTVKKIVKPSLLHNSTFASASRVATVTLLRGVLVATSSVSSLLLIGDVVHLGLVTVWPAGVGLRRSDPCPTRLRSVLGFMPRFDFSLVEFFGPGIFFK